MKKILSCYFLIFISQNSFSQNIGIGTTNPTRAKLELHGAVGATTAIFGGDAGGISLQRNAPGIGFNQYYSAGSKYISNGYGAVQWFDHTTGYMALDMFGNGVANGNGVGGKRAFTIANNGNMGIQTVPANASLYVIKSANFDGSAIFGGSTYNSNFHYGIAEHTYIRAGKAGGNLYLNDIPGGVVSMGGGTTKVGINTFGYPPAYTLEVRQVKEASGTETGILLVNSLFNQWEIFNSLPLFFKYNGVAKSYIDQSDGRYAQLSDRRLKTNIQPMTVTLDKLMKLNPVTYQLKNGDIEQESRIGFIAQEVKPLFPGLVSVSKDTSHGYKGFTDLHMMDYSSLGVIAIKAIQEQQQVIIDLQKRMQLLEEQNKILYQLLSKRSGQ